MPIRSRFTLLTAGLAAASLGLVHAATPPVVRVESGLLQGTEANGVQAFKGIPYAAPPVGALRWRPPQPAETWSGARDATAYGPDCMQAPFPPDAAPIRTQPSEDCLTLNVWRPAARIKRAPVMVWIHGGGFVNGGSSPAVYSGEAFARRGVVLVSINYRLGRFGFFAFPALTREHADEPKGNYGFMDQIAALQWVRRNISGFGGDPQNVTVFGESAGGMSIHALLLSPAATGLFQKAIVESGGGRSLGLGAARRLSEDAPGIPSAEAIGVNFARQKGIEGEDAAALAKLRALPAESVTSGLNMLSLLVPGPATFAGPMLDGRIVRDAPDVAYAAGHAPNTLLLIGANDDDLGLSFAASVDQALAPFGPDRLQAARAAYDPKGTGDVRQVNARVGADRMMIEPARFAARAFADRGTPVYQYRFGYVAQAMRHDWAAGAPHASEIPYVFDTVAARYGTQLAAPDAAVADRLNAYWVNFARTGDPNGPGLPPWPRYEPHSDALLQVQADGAAVAGPDPLKVRLDLTASLQK